MKQAAATARRFTAAFKTGKRRSLLKVFSEEVHAQENVAELAKRMTVSREHLYRVFSVYLNPRFGTILSFLNALELRFAVERLPQTMRLRS